MVLSNDNIQTALSKVQTLSADYICFDELYMGTCIVYFKQKIGDTYRSGSILIDEQGEVMPIKISCDTKYDGFESLKPGCEGSSLLQLRRIKDLDGNYTKYIHYSLEVHEIKNGKQYWHSVEGIYDTVDENNMALVKNLKGVKATLWSKELMCVSHFKDTKMKYGVLSIGWSNKWLIKPNMAYVEYKEGELYTYNENDIKLGKGVLFTKQLEPYIIVDNGDKKLIDGSVIDSVDGVIRSGGSAGSFISEISSDDFENCYSKRLFLTDYALFGLSDNYRAIRDVQIIDNLLWITDRKQVINYNIPLFVNKENVPLPVSILINGMCFEDAFAQHNEYITVLIKYQKLKISESVIMSMLQEKDEKTDEQDIRELLAIKYNLYNIFAQPKIAEIEEATYKSPLDKLDVILIGKVYVVRYVVGYDIDDLCQSESTCDWFQELLRNGRDWKNLPVHNWFLTIDSEGFIHDREYDGVECYLLIDNNGKILCNQCGSVIRIKDLILYERGRYEEIWSAKSSECNRSYYKIEEQCIISSNGEIIYKGDLGDLTKVSASSKYLLLEKPKFTKLEKDKIEYYVSEFVGEKCPECDGEVYWDKYDDCYVCDDCGCSFSREDWELSQMQLLAADDFEDVLASKEVSNGQFLTMSWQDREFYEEERLLYLEECDSSYDDSYCCRCPDKVKIDKYLEEKIYALFSLFERSLLIPFQKCKIQIEPNRFDSGIYLVDENKEEGIGIRMPFVSKLEKGKWQWNTFLGKDVLYFSGTVFSSIFDTFCYGPLTGMSLSLAFKKEFKLLIKYLCYESIFVTTSAMKQLYQKYNDEYPEKIARIIIRRDYLYDFENIKETTDIIIGKAAYWGKEEREARYYGLVIDYAWYDGMTFDSLVKSDLGYITEMVRTCKIKVSQNILSKYSKSEPFYEQLKDAFFEQNSIIVEEEEMKREAREAEWERYENEIDKRDTWNAMTDGQYGEMPDGFDDDYDFMG